MEEEITIKIPKGKKAIKTIDENGNVLINFVHVKTSKSKSWSEFCENNPITKTEYYLNEAGDIEEYSSLVKCRDFMHKNHLETREDAIGIASLIKLTRLHDEWVKDSDYKKYDKKSYIYIDGRTLEMGMAVGESHHLLDFPSSKMAEEFMNCFKKYIEDAKKFL